MKTRDPFSRALSFAMICVMLFSMLLLSGCGNGLFWSVEKSRSGVVRILSSDKPLGDEQLYEGAGTATGSGFGVGTPGKATDIFVTNRHVVTNEEDGSLCKYIYILLEDDAWCATRNRTLSLNNDGTVSDKINSGYLTYNPEHIIECEVLYPSESDPEYPDVAVIRASRVVTERIALPMRSAFEMKQFDTVYTFGFPGSTDKPLFSQEYDPDSLTDHSINYTTVEPRSASLSSITGTKGEIAIANYEPPIYNHTTLILHKADINHGNSGGPLLDDKGYVVGINTYGFDYSGTGVPENFASLYIDYALAELDKLGISYSTEPAVPVAMIAAGVGAVVLVLLIVLVVSKRGKKGGGYRLQCVTGVYAGRRFPIEGTLRIGRDPSRSDLVVSNQNVSGLHCQLEVKGGALFLRDCRSTNGTLVNGKRIEPDMPVKLKVGDKFSLATADETYVIALSGQ